MGSKRETVVDVVESTMQICINAAPAAVTANGNRQRGGRKPVEITRHGGLKANGGVPNPDESGKDEHTGGVLILTMPLTGRLRSHGIVNEQSSVYKVGLVQCVPVSSQDF